MKLNKWSTCTLVSWNAVVGVPDEKSGEAVKIHVVRKDESLTEEALKASATSS